MVVDDRMRLRIHHKLEELIGSEEADALVGSAIPAPGQELATKDDLRVLSSDLRVVEAELRGEIEKVRGEIGHALATQTRWMIGFMMSWSTVVLAAARLLF